MKQEIEVEYVVAFNPEVEAYARACFQTYWNMNGLTPNFEWVHRQIHAQEDLQCPGRNRIFEMCKQFEREIC